MAKGNETSNNNTEATFFALAVVSVGIVLLMWYFMRGPIVMFAYGLDWLQVKAYELVMRGLGERGQQYLDAIESVFDNSRKAESVQWSEFVLVSEAVGRVVAIPVTIAIAAMALIVRTRMKGDGFKNKYKLTDYIAYQSLHWGTLVPSARYNPDGGDKRTAPSKNPSDWMHDLGLKVVLGPGDKLPEAARLKAEKEFERQLGNGWGPLNGLKVYARVLFIMFAAHGAKLKGSYKLREDIARTYADIKDPAKRDKHLEELIAPFMEQEAKLKPFLDIANRHAYVVTALIAVLKQVRKKQGVLASAEFVWLKAIDRDLWYGMNNTGRRAFMVESAGSICHYQYEVVLRRPIPEPKVEEAILGLEGYISHHGIDERDEV